MQTGRFARPWPVVGLAILAGALAVALAAGVAFGQATQTGGSISLTTRPPVAEIVPDVVEEPTRFIIEARGAQGPLRNAYIDVEITAPTSGAFASTDIPAIEGTTLLRSRFGAPEGRLEFDYVMPIRGAYKVRVQASPGPGAAFPIVSQEFDLRVNENPQEVVYFWSMMAGLLVVGLVAGVVLGYANRGARAAG